jgi:PAP2 superfamily
MRRKRLVGRMASAAVVLVLLALGLAGPASARPGGGRTPPRATPSLDQLTVTHGDNPVLQWNAATLQAIRDTAPAPPVAARALAIVHTAMFDAWAAYDRRAVGTRLGPSLRRPERERTPAAKRAAVSHAAYRALVDVFPTRAADFTARLRALGYDPANRSTAVTTPAGVGNAAAAALLAYRHRDGSNQLGDLAPGPYADWTGYRPVNTPDLLADPSRWQPLRLPDGTTQRFSVPHWGRVRPFSLRSGAQLRATPPPAFTGDEHLDEVDELLGLSARLDDRTKAIAEYWSDGPRSELPPGHWNLFATWVSKRDRNSLDADVKLFFALAGAQLDAGIAAWNAKRSYDNERPVAGVRFLRQGQTVSAWGGPYQGTREIPAEQWQPYFRADVVTPPFPDHVSGHSTFSAAGATVLAAFTGSDRFGARATVRRGSSLIEPGATPSTDVTLSWPTFSAAADEAGMSRRYGGIHYRSADLAGRSLGRKVGVEAVVRAMSHIWGVGLEGSRPRPKPATATLRPAAPRPSLLAAAPPRPAATPPRAAPARPRQPKVGGYHPAAAGEPVREFLAAPWGTCLSHPSEFSQH